MNINQVFVAGNLTRIPELKRTPSGADVANFSVAVNRTYTKDNGEKVTTAIFVPIIVWGKQALNCYKFLTKGSSVVVQGRLDIRNYENKEGQKRTITEVIAENVQFAGPAPSNNNNQQQQTEAEPEIVYEMDENGNVPGLFGDDEATPF